MSMATFLICQPFCLQSFLMYSNCDLKHMWTVHLDLLMMENYPSYNCPCSAFPGQPLIFSDQLWDDEGCSATLYRTYTTCCSNTNQPWFHC